MTRVIRPLTEDDRAWVRDFIARRWGAEIVVAHSVVYRPAELPGFIARVGKEYAGLVTYHIARGECEIVTLDSTRENGSIGTALLDAVKHCAHHARCSRIWLITTNDNLNALRFYQKRGFVLVTVHCNAVEQSRAIKPEIPLIGNAGIPVRDEIELEKRLAHSSR